MDIVNTISGIRHSGKKTVELDDVLETELMDMAMNSAITLLKYKKKIVES